MYNHRCSCGDGECSFFGRHWYGLFRDGSYDAMLPIRAEACVYNNSLHTNTLHNLFDEDNYQDDNDHDDDDDGTVSNNSFADIMKIKMEVIKKRVHPSHYRIEDRKFLRSKTLKGYAYNIFYDRMGNEILPMLSVVDRMKELKMISVIKQHMHPDQFKVIQNDLLGNSCEFVLCITDLEYWYNVYNNIADAAAAVETVASGEVVTEEVPSDTVETVALGEVVAEEVPSVAAAGAVASGEVVAEVLTSSLQANSSDEKIVSGDVVAGKIEQVEAGVVHSSAGTDTAVLSFQDVDEVKGVYDIKSILQNDNGGGKMLQKNITQHLTQETKLILPIPDPQNSYYNYLPPKDDIPTNNVLQESVSCILPGSIVSRRKHQRSNNNWNAMKYMIGLTVSTDPTKLNRTLIPFNEGNAKELNKAQLEEMELPNDTELYSNMKLVEDPTKLKVVKDKHTGQVFYYDPEGVTQLSKEYPRFKGGYYYCPKDFGIKESKLQHIIDVCLKFNQNLIPVALLFYMRHLNTIKIKKDEDVLMKDMIEYELSKNGFFVQAKNEFIMFMERLKHCFIEHIDGIELGQMKRFIWHTWNLNEAEYDSKYDDDSVAARQATRSTATDHETLSVEELRMNQHFHYFVIMLHSQGSSDDATLKNYMKLCMNIPDVRTALRIFIGRDFNQVYALLGDNIFKNGMNSQRAEAQLSMLLLSAIEYNYGLPTDTELKAFYQSGEKKVVITTNETRPVDCKAVPVGKDRHVISCAEQFFKELFPKAKNSEIETMCNMLCFSGTLPPSIAWSVNELLAQMAQFLQTGKDSAEEKFALRVLGDMKKQCPSKYDTVIKKMCKKNHQLKLLYPNKKGDNEGSNKRRKTRLSSQQK